MERGATRHPRAPALSARSDSNARAGVGWLSRPLVVVWISTEMIAAVCPSRGSANGRIVQVACHCRLARRRPAGHRRSLRGRTGASTVVAGVGLVERAAPTAPVGEAPASGPCRPQHRGELPLPHASHAVPPLIACRDRHLPGEMEAGGSLVAPYAVEPARGRRSRASTSSSAPLPPLRSESSVRPASISATVERVVGQFADGDVLRVPALHELPRAPARLYFRRTARGWSLRAGRAAKGRPRDVACDGLRRVQTDRFQPGGTASRGVGGLESSKGRRLASGHGVDSAVPKRCSGQLFLAAGLGRIGVERVASTLECEHGVPHPSIPTGYGRVRAPRTRLGHPVVAGCVSHRGVHVERVRKASARGGPGFARGIFLPIRGNWSNNCSR